MIYAISLVGGGRGSSYFTLLKRIVRRGRLLKRGWGLFEERFGSLKFDANSTWINFFLERHRVSSNFEMIIS